MEQHPLRVGEAQYRLFQVGNSFGQELLFITPMEQTAPHTQLVRWASKALKVQKAIKGTKGIKATKALPVLRVLRAQRVMVFHQPISLTEFQRVGQQRLHLGLVAFLRYQVGNSFGQEQL